MDFRRSIFQNQRFSVEESRPTIYSTVWVFQPALVNGRGNLAIDSFANLRLKGEIDGTT